MVVKETGSSEMKSGQRGGGRTMQRGMQCDASLVSRGRAHRGVGEWPKTVPGISVQAGEAHDSGAGRRRAKRERGRVGTVVCMCWQSCMVVSASGMVVSASGSVCSGGEAARQLMENRRT